MELPQLQSLIGKDPISYREDFLLQYEHFKSEIILFKLNPSIGNKRFTNLVNFLTSVSHFYIKDSNQFPYDIIR